MTFETQQPSLESQQQRLDRLFSTTPETRHRLDMGDVPVSEIRRVYSQSCKDNPWAFMRCWRDVWWAGAGMDFLYLGLGLLILLRVLAYGKSMLASNVPVAAPFTMLGVFSACFLICLALKEMKAEVQSLLRRRRAALPFSRPGLQVIDAEVSTFRFWDSSLGWEFGRIQLMSELVLHSIERAVPGDSQAVRDGRVSLPGSLHPFLIVGRVRLYLIAGVHRSAPEVGRIVGITLFEGASVTEKKPNVEPRTDPADLDARICADE